MTKPLTDLEDNRVSQTEKIASQKAQVEQLTSETEAALSGLDGKLTAAVPGTRADVETPFQDMSAKLHTFAVGIKAEVQALHAGTGAGKGANFEGKGGKGGGIDKKDVAVGKLCEDLTKIQYRHWSNAVDIQLEAVHAWSCADYILNRAKRCADPMTPETFARCLDEATVDISSDPDIDMLAPDPSEHPFAERTRFLYAYLMGKWSADLYDRVASIESKNGFEVYRQIPQMIDAVPANAEFVMTPSSFSSRAFMGRRCATSSRSTPSGPS